MAANPAKLKRVKELQRPDILFALARHGDDSQLLAASSDARLHEFDVMADKPEPRSFEAAHRGFVTSLAVTASGQAVSGAYDGRLIWWDTASGKPVRQVDAHAKWIRDVVASPDGTTVLSVADDMVCRVWDAGSGKLIRELKGHAERTPNNFPSMLYCVCVSPDGRLAATADKLGKAIVWDLKTGQQRAAIEAPVMYTWDGRQRIHSIGGIRSAAFSPDSRQLAVGGIGTIGNIDHLGALARVEVFDWEQGERTHEFKGDTHKGLVERLMFGPDGKWLCAVGGDNGGFIQFLDLDKTNVLKQDKAPMHVHDAQFDADFETLYAVGHNRAVVWSIHDDTPQPPQELLPPIEEAS